jgi:putative PIN family toxin of toxin-antitoxin system
MSDRVFVDTNIFIYLYSNDEQQKKIISQKTLEKYDCIISTQVLNEFSNVCFRKFKKSTEEVELAINEIMENSTVSLIDNNTIKLALRIHKQYEYNSYYDCLMVAAALDSNCKYLITEDMADGQIIDNKLTLINIYSENNVKKYLG